MMRKIMMLLLVLVLNISTTIFTIHASSIDNDFDDTCIFMTEEDFNADFEQFESETPNTTGFSMKTYFQNLYTYSPMNSQGSCGYVSFIQYLSYLDTFINDNLIPNEYERNQGNANSIDSALSISPGVLRQSYPKINLYDYIQNNKSTDFQMFLMDIVNSYNNNSPSTYSYSIGMWNYYKILNTLFPTENMSFSYSRASDIVNNINAKPTDIDVINGFDAYVKSQLDLGHPVILHIAEHNKTTGKKEKYHSVVAYYYDENGIHAHFGWGVTSTDVIISSNYQITEAGVIDLSNVPVKHSNNYIINNIGYCGCGMRHYHNYENHYCSICNEYTIEHDYHAPYTWVNLTQHKATCGCGATTNQGHMVSSNAFANGNRFATCLVCGGKAERGFIQVDSLSNVAHYVTDNGSYILPNGVIVLVDEDIELYLKGNLKFHKKHFGLVE